MSDAPPIVWLRRLGPLAGFVGAVVYLIPGLWTPTEYVDGGLLFGYVRRIAETGDPPHVGFVDIYGVLNWPVYSVGYWLSGEQMWGGRISLLLMKLACVGLGAALIRHFARPVFAYLGAALLVIFLGMRWPLLATPYSFLPVLVLELAAWLWLVRSRAVVDGRLLAAAAATGLAIGIKVSTGVYLLAGALCWIMYARPTPDDGNDRLPRWATQGALLLGFAAYLAVWIVVVGARWSEPMTFAYLAVPLLLLVVAIGLVWPSSPAFGRRVATALAFVLASLVALIVAVAALIGPENLVDYARVSYGITSTLEYVGHLPPLGAPEFRVGFNENYWTQLPWLLSAVFALWLFATGRRAREDERSRELIGLWALHTAHAFVMFPRLDVAHVFQSMLATLPPIFAVLGQLDRAMRPRGGFARYAPSGVASAVVAAAVFTLASWPSPEAVLPPEEAWANEHMQHVRLRPEHSPDFRQVGPISGRVRDQGLNELAQYVDSITEDGTEILVMNPFDILYFASNTEPVGGRYHYYYFLVINRFFTRADFDAEVPPEELQRLLTNPPPVIIGNPFQTTFQGQFPEVNELLRREYQHTRSFNDMRVFERKGHSK